MKKKKSDIDDGKVWAFLGIFLTVIGFIIVLLIKKNNRYAMYYAKQGLVLFIVYVAVGIVNGIIAFIPFGKSIGLLLWIGMFVLWIIGIVYSLSGEEKEIPFIGEFAKKIKV
ncbi:MAG: DUF4870 domain-containing protein [Nanoarchaeota archaeon]|nr:hypothetical protein [Nanoarchaeota archaeon]MBU1632378.1 hypothetical protein [Nanoarchaeota archaeon]MBU1876720.1 hypothetical protein [Nanoarchaeota archaeon]